MSAIARWFNANGVIVMGYDKTPTRLTDELISEGIDIHFEDDIAHVVGSNLDKETTLVVLTPAIPKDHKEWNYLKEQGYTIKKRSEVLGILTKDNFTIAVAGTHGKTTTSSMIAHVLKHCGLDISAFLGGITANYNSNLIIGEKSAPVVVEADEFDRSFLTLFPSIAVVTSTDADHLDIYGKHEELKRTFNLFVNQIRENGQLFYQESLDLEVPKTVRSDGYSSKNKGLHFAENIHSDQGISVFDFVSKGFGKRIDKIRLQIPGFHNIENAVAAISVAIQMGISEDRIKNGIESFLGVRRRFEYVLRNEKHVYIDDYAHHPTEISAFLTSVKSIYPLKHLTVIFQPHLFTRTRDFLDGFAESLSLADTLLLLDIYPARELPIEGITSQVVFEKVTISDKHICSKSNLMELVKELKNKDLIVTVGAGDIDTFVLPIKQYLNEN